MQKMKADKKPKKILPEVHILGDLQDAKNLLSVIRKKKRIMIFRDGELDTFYTGVKGEIKQISQNEITNLEKDHRLVFFSFFPGRKKAEPLMEIKPDVLKPEKTEKKIEVKKKVTVVKPVNKDQHVKIVAKKRVTGTAKVKLATKEKPE